VKRVGAFLWDFVVGDDWVGAAGVVIVLAVTALVAHATHAATWWIMPPGVTVVLALTLRRAVRALPSRVPPH
jgi:fumarate reductase subunit C